MNWILIWIVAVSIALALYFVWLTFKVSPDFMPSLRRRRARRIEAVRRGLDALQAVMPESGPQPLNDAVRTVLEDEVNDLLSLLPRDAARTARLWRNSYARRETSDQFRSALGALARALDARATAVDEPRLREPSAQSSSGQARSPVSPGVTPAPSASSDASSGDAESSADGVNGSPAPANADVRDDALLASISKKFYESWAFKGLSAALLAGVALALGGSFILGGETYRLSEELQQKYKDGVAQFDRDSDKLKTSLKEIRDQADRDGNKATAALKEETAALKEKGELLTAASKAVQDQRKQFDDGASAAMNELRTLRQNFTQELKTSTVDEIVSDLGKNIETRTGEISARIKKVEETLQPKLDALSGRVDKLDTSASALDTNLSKQSEKLAKATEEIQSNSKEFVTTVGNATNEVKKKLQQYAEALKDNTTEQVILGLKQDIQSRTGAISDRIASEEADLQPKFDGFGDRLKKLNTAMTTIENELDTARTDLTNLVPRLNPLQSQVTAAEQAVARIQTADGTAAQANSKAEDYAGGALRAWNDSAADRGRIATQLDIVSKGLAPQQTALTDIAAAVVLLRASLQRATNQVNAATQDATQLKDLAVTVLSLSQTVKALQDARLDKRISDIESKKPVPPQPPQPPPQTRSRNFDNLTPAEKCEVQRQLKSFYSGNIDGIIGQGTQRAIRRWQANIRVRQTGRLEPPSQINLLIGTGSVPPCP